MSDEFSAGGQPTPVDLKQLADQGFKSVVNLRSSNEVGALVDEQQQAENVGLQYVNVPLQPTEANADLTAAVLAAVELLPTPVFFHCGAGGRASAAALITFATQQKLSRKAVLEKAATLGINPEQPQLQQFLDGLV
ncbi:phosphatase [Phormidium sp. FACHB-592]|uniref:beta-lactamase hydrolase domain-containing protein n=1 Tax=Cyanophyceae TaxID=3028117 RepID=UPI0016848AF8|nr:phosphatase [Phormidium sp. FACHB-592]